MSRAKDRIISDQQSTIKRQHSLIEAQRQQLERTKAIMKRIAIALEKQRPGLAQTIIENHVEKI